MTAQGAGARTPAVTWRRLRGPGAWFALGAVVIAALATSIGAEIAGRLADHATWNLVVVLACVLLGGAILDTAGRIAWVGVINKAAGRLRHDLLDAVLAQPLQHLTEQAVGEVLDRVDDDTQEVATLLRLQMWQFARTAFSLAPLWVVAGLTWWPAWIIFPLFAGLTYLVTKPLLAPIAELKVVEEAAWTDHAAALEEGVAGRDDARTSLAQPFLISRLTRLSAVVHERVKAVVLVECRLLLRAGAVLHGLLAVIVVVGAALVWSGHESIGSLVTLFLVTTGFVGALSQLSEQMPDLQAGLGAVMRLRQLMAVPSEERGGEPVPEGLLELRFEHLDFSYDEGTFGLRDVTMTLPAGETLALVGRTGSGKSTLASLVSRAVEPPRGTVFLGDADLRDVDLESLRTTVGVVTQRTEILTGTLAQNITLFEDVPRARVEDIIERLGLTAWVASLPEGIDTPLGAGGTALSAGEEQLLSFARLMARDVRVVVLDEATARMDPLTEARVVAAAGELLRGRTGILIAHRLGTISRADRVAVLDGGRLVQEGPRAEVAAVPGRFRDLLVASGASLDEWTSPSTGASRLPLEQIDDAPAAAAATSSSAEESPGVTDAAAERRQVEAPEEPALEPIPSLARGIWHALLVRPRWGLVSWSLFMAFNLAGASGALTGYFWGHTASALTRGETPWGWLAGLVVAVMLGPVFLAAAIRNFPRWWVEVSMRTRLSILIGQSSQRRLKPTPAGEVVGRAMDSNRYAGYADRWIDFVNGLALCVVTALVGGTYLAGLVLLVIMVAAALSAMVGRPIAGRSATIASTSRAQFGRTLVSVLESARTVKLAGRTESVRRHVLSVDADRVAASTREQRIRAVLDAVPQVLVQVGIVLAWAGSLWGWWGLATALLVANVASGFDWFGRVAGAVVTDVPGTRSWQLAASRLAGGGEIVELPPGVDLLTGEAPQPELPPRVPLERMTLEGLGAVHEDGTVGVSDVDLEVRRGELVLLLGRVGSGKSSLLKALAGLLSHTGSLRWNGREVEDAEVFLRPGQIAYVAQTPRVFSGTFADNVMLGHERGFDAPVEDARLGSDVTMAGGAQAIVGHRGVRLSGGQVQRLALARALATEAEVLVADDVSSALDAATELELWDALRQRGVTVVGATSKRSALARADRVVVLDAGRVVDSGPWSTLESRWAHLAG